jgi:hypothetical protein
MGLSGFYFYHGESSNQLDYLCLKKASRYSAPKDKYHAITGCRIAAKHDDFHLFKDFAYYSFYHGRSFKDVYKVSQEFPACDSVCLDSIRQKAELELRKNLNFEAINRASRLQEADQWIRFVKKSNVLDSVPYTKVKRYSDSVLVDRVFEFIEEFGFPAKEQVGPELHNKFLLMLVHIAIEKDEHFDTVNQYFKEGLMHGEVHPKMYAFLNDMHQWNIEKSGCEKYSSEMFEVYDSTSYTIRPLCALQEVDKYRREIGMEPLYFHLQRWNLVPPQGYSFDLEEFEDNLLSEILNR